MDVNEVEILYVEDNDDNIYMLKIKSWNDPAIAALNSGVTLPNTPIVVVHRSEGSGTTDNFTNYLTCHQDCSFEYTGTITMFPFAQVNGLEPGESRPVTLEFDVLDHRTVPRPTCCSRKTRPTRRACSAPPTRARS